VTNAMQSVYTPPEVANYTKEIVERRYENRALALTTGIPTLDKHMRPVLPGEVIVVQANTGQGKTSFMQIWARNIVKQLHDRQDINEVVVYVSWETQVEQLGLYDLAAMSGVDSSSAWHGDIGEAELLRLRDAATRRSVMPLWIIGHSLKRRRGMDGLTLPVVSDAMRKMEDDRGIKPAIVFIDYLQKIDPVDMRADRRVQVIDNTDKLTQLARDCGAPVIVAAQSGRQVLTRDFKLPEIGDAQESSRIEQDADKVLSIWYTPKTEVPGRHIPELGLDVADDLLILGIRKQRHAPSGQIMPLSFDPARNTLVSWHDRGWDG
jgi:replicative DNA helicase